MNEAAPMNWHGAFSKMHYYGEKQLSKRVYTMQEYMFKNKRICMHILICALINFGRKLKGLVTEAAFQEGNWEGGGRLLFHCITFCNFWILYVLWIRLNFWLRINELKAIPQRENTKRKKKKQKQNVTSDCVVVRGAPCSLYFSIFNPVSLMSMFWFKMGKRIIFKKLWQSH